MGILRRIFSFNFGEIKDQPEHEFSLDSLKNGIYNKWFKTDRIRVIQGIHKELDEDIQLLKNHIHNFNLKLELVNKLVSTGQIEHLDAIKIELERIKKLISTEYDDDKKEDKYIIKALKSIDKAILAEKDMKLSGEEEEIEDELRELKVDVENMQPCLLRQMDFFKKPANVQEEEIKNLLFDIKEEAAIIGYERKVIKDLQKKIEQFELDAVIAPD